VNENEEALTPCVERVAPSSELELEGLRALWVSIVGQDQLYQGAAFDQVVASLVVQVRAGSDRAALEFGAGAWTIDLKAATVGGALQSALLAGILWANGLDGIPAAVASAVIPAVVALESVKLTPGEQIRFQLVRDALDPDRGRSVKAIRKKLPSKAREEISEAELADFLERLRSAGVVDSHDGKYTGRDRPSWFRITLR
jgi:hypothetical protein